RSGLFSQAVTSTATALSTSAVNTTPPASSLAIDTAHTFVPPRIDAIAHSKAGEAAVSSSLSSSVNESRKRRVSFDPVLRLMPISPAGSSHGRHNADTVITSGDGKSNEERLEQMQVAIEQYRTDKLQLLLEHKVQYKPRHGLIMCSVC